MSVEVTNTSPVYEAFDYLKDFESIQSMSNEDLCKEIRNLKKLGHQATLRIGMNLLALKNRAIGEDRLKEFWERIPNEVGYCRTHVESLIRVASYTPISYMSIEILCNLSFRSLSWLSSPRTIKLPGYKAKLKVIKGMARERYVDHTSVREVFYPFENKNMRSLMELGKKNFNKMDRKSQEEFSRWTMCQLWPDLKQIGLGSVRRKRTK